MKKSLAILLLSSLTVFGDELPELFEKPWTAWYCGHEGKNFHFGVDPDGEAALMPLKKKERFSSREWIKVTPVIEEVLPGGRVVTKQAIEDGWEAITESTNEAETISYRGTVTGGARFEVHFEIDGDVVRGGGRILEKGELTKNPIRFAIRVKIPNCYSHEKDQDKLEKKVKRDKVSLVMADNSKKRFDVFDPVNATEENGDGVRSARIDLAGYDGGRIELDAGDAGLFEFWNGGENPLYKGFTLGWKPDPAKDPKGEARFELEYK